MDIAHLADDELLIEFEVRKLSDTAAREVTEALKFTLGEKLDEEKGNFLLRPTVAHEAATKNPKREVQQCSDKLKHLKQILLLQQHEPTVNKKNLEIAQSKLMHIHDRLVRISTSAAASKVTPMVFKACNSLVSSIKKLTGEAVDPDVSFEAINNVDVPDVPNPVDIVEKPSRLLSVAGPSNKPGTSSPNDKLKQGNKIASGNQTRKTHAVTTIEQDNFDGETVDPGERSHNLTLENSLEDDARQDPLSLDDLLGTLEDSPRPLDPRICQDLGFWNLKFEGMGGKLHIERFFYRAERMARRSQIPLDSLVDYISVLLADDALDWYWRYLERNGVVSWKVLKQEMIQRYESSRSDDEVIRTLLQRKQQFPRESFKEFYDSIMNLALQAKNPLTDRKIYNFLRRNMRPGLQMELHDTPVFPSLSSFWRRCVSLEEMWNRFGFNPEAGMHPPSSAIHSNYGNRPVRKVNEMRSLELGESVGDDEASASEHECVAGDICAVNGNKNMTHSNTAVRNQEYDSGASRRPWRMLRSPPGATASRESRVFNCWNCGQNDHVFHDCRIPITHVFCFGCGARDTYKPDCTRCSSSGNWRGEMGKKQANLVSSQQPTTRKSLTAEDSASNTDPELYRRQTS